jgi:hypothetical protein
VNPNPSAALPSEQDLQQWMSCLRSAAKNFGTTIREIGYYGAKIRAADAWSRFGYADEIECRHDLDIPKATWYRYLAICTALPDLSLQDLQKISISNLELMTEIEGEVRYDYNWIADAQRMTPREFAQVIAERHTKAGSGYEPQTYYRVKVPFSTVQMLEEAVETFQERNGLASPGRALELMVADIQSTARPTSGSMSTMLRVRQILREVNKWLADHGIINEEVMNLLKEGWELLGESYQEALQASRQGQDSSVRQRRKDADIEQPGGEDAEEGTAVGAVEAAKRTVPRVQ